MSTTNLKRSGLAMDLELQVRGWHLTTCTMAQHQNLFVFGYEQVKNYLFHPH
jgi:hypothetical protein